MKNLLFVYAALVLLYINSIYGFMACKMFSSCSDDPYEGDGYYIGYTDEDERNMYICTKRYPTQEYVCSGRTCRMKDVISYLNCYHRDGDEIKNGILYPHRVDFKDPFSKSRSSVVVKSGNCYATSTGRVHITTINGGYAESAMSRNGRCLTKFGWCSC